MKAVGGDGLESSLPAPGIILDPMTDPGKPLKLEVIAPEKVGIEDIKKYTALTSRVNESLKKLASENKVVQATCNTNDKLNNLVAQFALYDDLEDAAVLANIARSLTVGFLKRGSYVASHKWEFTKQFFGGIVNTGAFLFSEYSKYQELDDAFWSFDADKLDATAQAYYEDSQAQAKHFCAEMDKLKAMSADDITESIGAGGFDWFTGATSLKALRLFAKGAGVEVLEGAYSLNEAARAETALAEANETVAATTEAFKTLPAVTKVTMEEGSDVIAETLYTVAKNPEIVEAEENFAKAIKKVANAANERGKAFEKFLEKKLGGKGSFKVKGEKTSREFDGAYKNIWYEAKSGGYWEMIMSNEKLLGDFKADIGRGLKVAKENGVIYALYSDTPIPQEIRNWLTEKGIPFKEFKEFDEIWKGK